MNLFYYAGHFSPHRDEVIKAGGIEAVFPKGEDICSYLKQNDLCVLIEEGFLDMHILTPKSEIYELVSYSKGCFIFSGALGSCPVLSSRYRLIPTLQPMRGILVPRRNMRHLQQSPSEMNNRAMQIMKEFYSLAAINTILFHTGSGMERVCNYLWHYDRIRRQEDIPDIIQDKIMYKTLLSKSQLTRVLAQLREQQIIQTRYREIEILDRERMRPYVSSMIQEYG